ncbi:protein exportin 1b [Quercus suber]|uniref:Protein exportin 1b n=1 Tax=Quercus suber TaxID=58331 RepID=A0AAW0LH79_QUESU
MWRTFRVLEVEGIAILLVETKPKALKEKGQFSLLAKLFTDKRFIGKTMKTTLCNLWNPKRGLPSEEVFDFLRGEMTQQKIKDLKQSLNWLMQINLWLCFVEYISLTHSQQLLK